MSYPGWPGAVQQQPRSASGPRAGFWRRFAAAFFDGIVLTLLNTILVVTLKGAGEVLDIVIAVAYYTVLEGGPRGQTLGKQALGIRVVSVEADGPIGYRRGFIRFVGRYISFLVLLLGYLWMLWDPERQCWHDKLAGDLVVPVSAYPLP
ncbi:MAG: RDD family protein [Acidobacteriota bacterium]|nr:RDD family protein [Acidobacteriota bacterium]